MGKGGRRKKKKREKKGKSGHRRNGILEETPAPVHSAGGRGVVE